jgi:hypothetical protein
MPASSPISEMSENVVEIADSFVLVSCAGRFILGI